LRINKEQDHILILPRGLSFSEATAASLVHTPPHILNIGWEPCALAIEHNCTIVYKIWKTYMEEADE